MIAIRVKATNDTNGNPRRGWLIVDDAGDTIEFVDEGLPGYRGAQIGGLQLEWSRTNHR